MDEPQDQPAPAGKFTALGSLRIYFGGEPGGQWAKVSHPTRDVKWDEMVDTVRKIDPTVHWGAVIPPDGAVMAQHTVVLYELKKPE